VENKVESVVENKVESKVDESMDIEQRRCNLVIMGLRRTRMMVVLKADFSMFSRTVHVWKEQ